MDVNNHSPQFEKQSYQFGVLESDAIGRTGQFLGEVKATDRDHGDNGRLFYAIASVRAREYFTIQNVSKRCYQVAL